MNIFGKALRDGLARGRAMFAGVARTEAPLRAEILQNSSDEISEYRRLIAQGETQLKDSKAQLQDAWERGAERETARLKSSVDRAEALLKDLREDLAKEVARNKEISGNLSDAKKLGDRVDADELRVELANGRGDEIYETVLRDMKKQFNTRAFDKLSKSEMIKGAVEDYGITLAEATRIFEDASQNRDYKNDSHPLPMDCPYCGSDQTRDDSTQDGRKHTCVSCGKSWSLAAAGKENARDEYGTVCEGCRIPATQASIRSVIAKDKTRYALCRECAAKNGVTSEDWHSKKDLKNEGYSPSQWYNREVASKKTGKNGRVTSVSGFNVQVTWDDGKVSSEAKDSLELKNSLADDNRKKASQAFTKGDKVKGKDGKGSGTVVKIDDGYVIVDVDNAGGRKRLHPYDLVLKNSDHHKNCEALATGSNDDCTCADLKNAGITNPDIKVGSKVDYSGEKGVVKQLRESDALVQWTTGRYPGKAMWMSHSKLRVENASDSFNAIENSFPEDWECQLCGVPMKSKDFVQIKLKSEDPSSTRHVCKSCADRYKQQGLTRENVAVRHLVVDQGEPAMCGAIVPSDYPAYDLEDVTCAKCKKATVENAEELSKERKRQLYQAASGALEEQEYGGMEKISGSDLVDFVYGQPGVGELSTADKKYIKTLANSGEKQNSFADDFEKEAALSPVYKCTECSAVYDRGLTALAAADHHSSTGHHLEKTERKNTGGLYGLVDIGAEGAKDDSTMENASKKPTCEKCKKPVDSVTAYDLEDKRGTINMWDMCYDCAKKYAQYIVNAKDDSTVENTKNYEWSYDDGQHRGLVVARDYSEALAKLKAAFKERGINPKLADLCGLEKMRLANTLPDRGPNMPDCELCGGGHAGELVPLKDSDDSVWYVCKQCAANPKEHGMHNSGPGKCKECGYRLSELDENYGECVNPRCSIGKAQMARASENCDGPMNNSGITRGSQKYGTKEGGK